MNKYKIGDAVKLKDDIQENEKFGRFCFISQMNQLKNKPLKILRITYGGYMVECGWIITDGMIEGIWNNKEE